MDSKKKPSLYDRAAERYLDRNGNGRFDANEFIDAERNVLRTAELSAKANPGRTSEDEIRPLEAMTLNNIRANFEWFQREDANIFPCGIETPNETQLANFVALSHQTAHKIRWDIAHPSLAAKIDAIGVLIADDIQFKIKFAAATAEVVVQSVFPATDCNSSKSSKTQR